MVELIKRIKFDLFVILSKSLFTQLLGEDVQTHTDTWTHRHIPT